MNYNEALVSDHCHTSARASDMPPASEETTDGREACAIRCRHCSDAPLEIHEGNRENEERAGGRHEDVGCASSANGQASDQWR